MKAKLITKPMQTCIENGNLFYWQTRRDELALHAVTYTWENGSCRSRKLIAFDIREQEQIEKAFRVHVELCKRIKDPRNNPDIVYALKDAWWNGKFQTPPETLLQQTVFGAP